MLVHHTGRKQTAEIEEPQVLSVISDWINSDNFSCLAAKAAVRRGLLTHSAVGRLGSADATGRLHRHLEKFVTEALSSSENFATFVAVFDEAPETSEEDFENALWQQLQSLHEHDSERYTWAAGAAQDPDSARFAFSVAGHPFFVVGLHAGASRVTRRFPRPAIAFNSHHQFERLKESGVYAGLQRRIREREIRLQGSINPNLREYGDTSEAPQYSGRHAEDGWACPFRPKVLQH
ncbi:guanitoxin biosynthesis heme-dependent pre-guanitoxin N-hydroxylase GntA [Streptomyces sp. bgisy100]|uniref:guanitoxin biosynthesis heme-dependent pre-guanitoxin N-hydroxylase GntA n=1 Tax=Streptomyces sp. bgisy100 TaxID=3413783 RepID=UPI003D726EB6